MNSAEAISQQGVGGVDGLTRRTSVSGQGCNCENMRYVVQSDLSQVDDSK